MSALLDRIRNRRPPAPPSGPQPPEGEALEAARRFLGHVTAYESARLARVGPQGALDAARGRLASALRWRQLVEKHDGSDFTFKDPRDIGDEGAPRTRVRREVVEANADEAIARDEQDVRAAELSLATADIALSLALRQVCHDLDDGQAAEQMLRFESFEAGRALAEAEGARSAADRDLREACTAAAVPRPRTLQSILMSGRRPSTPEVVQAEERLAAAVETRQAAAAEVGRVQEETRTFHSVVSVALEKERESIARASERAALEQETFVRRTAR
jgi:hypothetical protein